MVLQLILSAEPWMRLSENLKYTVRLIMAEHLLAIMPTNV